MSINENSDAKQKISCPKAYIIRGKSVMLDEDLAVFYGVTLECLQNTVTKKIKRFSGDSLFRITKKEKILIKIQNPELPETVFKRKLYAFGAEGITMLSSVLKSRKAVEIHINIIRELCSAGFSFFPPDWPGQESDRTRNF